MKEPILIFTRTRESSINKRKREKKRRENRRERETFRPLLSSNVISFVRGRRNERMKPFDGGTVIKEEKVKAFRFSDVISDLI